MHTVANRAPLRQWRGLQTHRSPEHRPVRRGAPSRNTSMRGQAEQRGAHKPVANGGIMAMELLVLVFEPRQPWAPGDRRQLLWVQSSSSAVPLFVRPIASVYPPTLGSHGVPQWDRGDDTDKCSGGSCKAKSRRTSATVHPTEARLSGASEGFDQRFP
jgi:hypothetical protein